MELSAELLFVLGIASSVIVWLLRELFVKHGKEIPVWIYSIALGVVSLILALLFAPVALPPFPVNDGSFLGILVAVLEWIVAVLPLMAGAVAFARVIYEVLLQRVLDGLGRKVRAALRPDTA